MTNPFNDLTGRTALVTGATGDLGSAVVNALVAAGATVHALGRRPERMSALAADGCGQIHGHLLDLDDPDAVTATLQAIGPIDVLVLAAAHAPERAPFLTGGMANLEAVMGTNFFSAARLVHAVLPGMSERGWGRIVHISSLAASLGEAHGPAYCASKAALDSLLRNLAIDYSPSGVTFNSIEPGPVETERLASWGAVKTRRLASAAATRRVGTPADIAHAVCFLTSPHAGYITGETLRVDGGLHLGNPLAAMYVREGSAASKAEAARE